MGDEKNQADKKPDKLEKADETPAAEKKPKELAREVGGRKGPEPTRYGDWENNGIASDF